jgi:uncharacterized protein (TIGR04141 family)
MNQVPNIFKINREHHHLKSFSETKLLIEAILDFSYQRQFRAPEEALILTSFSTGDINYYLYRYRKNTDESDWSKFLPKQLKDDQEFSESKLNLVLFIESNSNLFAWVGGSAFWLISSYIDHYFGLMIYDKIMSLEDDEAISTKSRGITGARMGMSEQFRDNFRIINYLQFGKIPKELQVKLNNDSSFRHFDFLLKKSTDKLQIAVGRSFKINKAINFDELHKISKCLDAISSLPAQDLISSYIPITNQEYLTLLKAELENRVWNSVPYTLGDTNIPDGFDFDFCNPNKIEAFYEAEKYQLMERTHDGRSRAKLLDTLYDKNEIYKRGLLRAAELFPNNKAGIISYLYRLNVQCSIGNRTTATSSFMYHFNAEFQIGKDAVFLVDSRWYSLKASFVKALSAQTVRLFKSSRLESGVMTFRWPYQKLTSRFIKEGIYNMKYDGVVGYIVLDTIIVDGVELCDILCFKDDVIYLIHVKHSFNARVRELTNQMVISARRLQEAISSADKPFFDSNYDKLKEKKRGTNGFTKDEFYQKFLDSKPIFVFATSSHLIADLKIEDNINRYDSNIARFSVTNCSSEIQTNYYEFRTTQIEREFI